MTVSRLARSWKPFRRRKRTARLGIWTPLRTSRISRLNSRHGTGAEADRSRRIEAQAVEALACAVQRGGLIESELTFDEFSSEGLMGWQGSEHLVELLTDEHRYGKITVPNGFGLVPDVALAEYLGI